MAARERRPIPIPLGATLVFDGSFALQIKKPSNGSGIFCVLVLDKGIRFLRGERAANGFPTPNESLIKSYGRPSFVLRRADPLVRISSNPTWELRLVATDNQNGSALMQVTRTDGQDVTWESALSPDDAEQRLRRGRLTI